MDFIEFIEVKDNDQIKEIEKLANKIWHEHYEPIIGKKQVDYMLSNFQSGDAIKNQIKSGYRYFLALFKGEKAGYFAILDDIFNCQMFLSKLYVDKKYRSNGIAKRAIYYIEDICKDLKLQTIWLTVNKYNSNSIIAYEKMGFVRTDAIIQDIGNGYIMDDYKMEKIIFSK